MWNYINFIDGLDFSDLVCLCGYCGREKELDRVVLFLVFGECGMFLFLYV